MEKNLFEYLSIDMTKRKQLMSVKLDHLKSQYFVEGKNSLVLYRAILDQDVN